MSFWTNLCTPSDLPSRDLGTDPNRGYSKNDNQKPCRFLRARPVCRKRMDRNRKFAFATAVEQPIHLRAQIMGRHVHVSKTTVAASWISFNKSRSRSIPSCGVSAGANGWRRRVSEKRRTRIALDAVTNTTSNDNQLCADSSASMSKTLLS